MKLNQMFPSNYAAADDLDGQDRTVTIRFVQMEKVGRDQQTVPVMYLTELDKPMILNKTNGRSIGKLWGHDSRQWEGKQVTLYPSKVDVQGETKDCIRIREELPRTGQATSAAIDDAIPF